jgi:hypothetical protein
LEKAAAIKFPRSETEALIQWGAESTEAMKHSMINTAGQRATHFSGTSSPLWKDASACLPKRVLSLIPKVSVPFCFKTFLPPLPSAIFGSFNMNRGSDSPTGGQAWNL